MKFLSTAALFTAAALCLGAEGDSANQRGNFGGQRRSFNGQGGNFGGQRRSFGGQRGGMQSQFMVEIEIAKKFPAEYAEVEKKREEYEAALAALAAKAEVKLPESRDAVYRKLRKADPAAFDAAMGKMKTSPREGFTELNALAEKHGIKLFSGRIGMMNRRGGGAPHGENSGNPGVRSFDRPDMSALRRKYPEEMKKYDSLRRSDPEKARKLLMEIHEKDKSVKK